MRNIEKRNYNYMPDGSIVSDIRTEKLEKKFKLFSKTLLKLVLNFEKQQNLRLKIVKLKISSIKQSITKINHN